MKILICTSFFEKRTNGTALFPNFALKINELYPEHEVRVVTTDAVQSYDKVIKVTFNYPRPVHAFYVFLSNFSFYNAVKKIKKEYDFDIVLFNHAASGVWSKWFLPKNVKVMGFIHDDLSLKANRVNYEKYRQYLIYRTRKYLEIIAINRFDKILCASKYTEKLVAQFVKNNAVESTTLYQSIDIKNITFNPPKNLSKDRIKILFVKPSYIGGGLLELIEAIKQLKDYQFSITIVGENLKQKPLIEAKGNDINHLNLQFLGYCPPQKVSELLYNHHILCIPSRAEVLGLANVEGLAHGTPVVTTDVGGIPEVMNYGKNGWLAEPNNPESLAKALHACIEADPSVLKEKSDAGRKYVEENFDYRIMIARFVDICEKLKNAA
jgi:colanic acid/amylovoran biosynthesis glycosyltransferase